MIHFRFIIISFINFLLKIWPIDALILNRHIHPDKTSRLSDSTIKLGSRCFAVGIRLQSGFPGFKKNSVLTEWSHVIFYEHLLHFLSSAEIRTTTMRHVKRSLQGGVGISFSVAVEMDGADKWKWWDTQCVGYTLSKALFLIISHANNGITI